MSTWKSKSLLRKLIQLRPTSEGKSTIYGRNSGMINRLTTRKMMTAKEGVSTEESPAGAVLLQLGPGLAREPSLHTLVIEQHEHSAPLSVEARGGRIDSAAIPP